ncbi:MAG: hypothetical protein ABI969_19500 [bacterium]
MTSRRITIACTLLALTACARATTPAVATSPTPSVEAGIERLRSATRAFQSLDSAVANGFVRDVPNCLVHEHHGAMGYHHINRTNLMAVPVVERPQLLLYERKPDGTYKLNGVEFIVPYSLYSRDSTPPVLLGQKLQHEDNLNIWYLHVWAWTTNPDGIFANFNPTVSCGTTGKVYKPFTRDM